jgi:hypothetical protein
MDSKDAMAPTRRRRRRPDEFPAVKVVKRPNLTFRLTEWMREALARAAALNGYSLSEEIEHRLARSLHDEDLTGNAQPVLHFAEDMVTVMRTLERRTGRAAFGREADPAAYLALWAAFDAWFARHRPRGAPALHGGPDDPEHRLRGETLLQLLSMSEALWRLTGAIVSEGGHDPSGEVERMLWPFLRSPENG